MIAGREADRVWVAITPGEGLDGARISQFCSQDGAVANPLPGIEVRTLRSHAPVRRISAARPRDGYRGPALSDDALEGVLTHVLGR